MMSQRRYPLLSVAAAWVMLGLSPVLDHPWNALFLLRPTGVAAQTAAPGHNQAGHRRAGAGGPKGQGAVEAPLSKEPKENVMAVSPERLQAVGVKFELAKRRLLDRTIRTVGQVEIDERRLAHVNIKLVRLSQNSRLSMFNGANKLRCFQCKYSANPLPLQKKQHLPEKSGIT